MSQVKVQGNASGTGVFTLAAPSGNTDRTLTLPDSAGTIATAESTLTQFNASGSAPVYACRAWVNFNGTFAGNMTLANGGIRASGNVSSITDNGVGNYTVNFTTAMQDANFSAVSTIWHAGGITPMVSVTVSEISITSQNLMTAYDGGALFDPITVNCAIFR